MTRRDPRQLERTWERSGTVEDEAASLLERVRRGKLDENKLQLAAYMGHGASILALGNDKPEPVSNDSERFHKLKKWPDALMRTLIAITRNRIQELSELIRIDPNNTLAEEVEPLTETLHQFEDYLFLREDPQHRSKLTSELLDSVLILAFRSESSARELIPLFEANNDPNQLSPIHHLMKIYLLACYTLFSANTLLREENGPKPLLSTSELSEASQEIIDWALNRRDAIRESVESRDNEILQQKSEEHTQRF